MASPLPFLTTSAVALPADAFAALHRAAAERPELAAALRDAGYAAGTALYDGFGAWLDERGESPPELLRDERFGPLLQAFFREAGWGALDVTPLSDAVFALDADDWAEAAFDGGHAAPSCHLSTGLLAGFFGRLADAPLAVLEVECRAAGDARCRFLLGSLDVLQYVHEAMQRGVSYERAAASAVA